MIPIYFTLQEHLYEGCFAPRKLAGTESSQVFYTNMEVVRGLALSYEALDKHLDVITGTYHVFTDELEFVANRDEELKAQTPTRTPTVSLSFVVISLLLPLSWP